MIPWSDFNWVWKEWKNEVQHKIKSIQEIRCIKNAPSNAAQPRRYYKHTSQGFSHTHPNWVELFGMRIIHRYLTEGTRSAPDTGLLFCLWWEQWSSTVWASVWPSAAASLLPHDSIPSSWYLGPTIHTCRGWHKLNFTVLNNCFS